MIRQLALVSAAALALGLAGCNHKDNTADANMAAANDMAMANDAVAVNETESAAAMNANMGAPMAGAQFANMAAASDAFEIASSRLAATHASSQQVKDFAAKMIAGHTESTAKLKAAAAQATPAMKPDPTLGADQQAKFDALGKLKGADFDKQYAADQVAAHEGALSMLQDYASNGDVAPVKAWASATAPVVQTHYDMAKALPQ